MMEASAFYQDLFADDSAQALRASLMVEELNPEVAMTAKERAEALLSLVPKTKRAKAEQLARLLFVDGASSELERTLELWGKKQFSSERAKLRLAEMQARLASSEGSANQS